jgi:hypothetical protein
MGQWEEFCTICGGPSWLDNTVSPYNMGGEGTAWLDHMIGITPAGQFLPIRSYTGYGSFMSVSDVCFDCKTNVVNGNHKSEDARGCTGMHGDARSVPCSRAEQSVGC